MSYRVRVKEICAERGITLDDLARLTGFSAGELGAWDRGERFPDGEKLYQFGHALGFDTEPVPEPPPMTPEELADKIEDIRWFSRFSVREKLRFNEEGLRDAEYFKHFSLID